MMELICTGIVTRKGEKKKKGKEKKIKSRKRTGWFYISDEDPGNVVLL